MICFHPWDPPGMRLPEMTRAAAGGALAVLTCTRVRRWPAWCLDLVKVRFSFSSAL